SSPPGRPEQTYAAISPGRSSTIMNGLKATTSASVSCMSTTQRKNERPRPVTDLSRACCTIRAKRVWSAPTNLIEARTAPMTSELTDLPQSLHRLEELLADAGPDAMLLAELDGFLCGLVVSPEPVARDEWWPFDWLADERGELRSGNEELAALIEARVAETEAELAADNYAPLFEVDEETEEIIWQVWISGFQQAMLLRFDAWDALLRDTESDS